MYRVYMDGTFRKAFRTRDEATAYVATNGGEGEVLDDSDI